MKKGRYLLISLVLCNILRLAAQIPDAKFDYLDIESGLSNNEVTSITEDKYGFIWVGTRGGLNKYDGYLFKHYKNESRNFNSLSNNSVETTFSDGRYLWVGTKSGGLSRYDLLQEQFENYKYQPSNDSSISSNRIISIYSDSQKRKWFGTWKNGINLFDSTSNSFRRYLPGQKVRDIKEDLEGNVWVASMANLAVYNPENDSFEDVPLTKGRSLQITHICNAGKFLYLGTWSNGLLKFDTETRKIVGQYRKKETGGTARSNNVYRVFLDSSGRLWVGSWRGGLHLFDEVKEQFYQVNLLSKNSGSINKNYDIILDIFEDTGGAIWIGTDGGGIVKIDERKAKFGLLDLERNSRLLLSNLNVVAIHKDKRGDVWFGTKNSGAFVKKKDDKQILPFELPFIDERVGKRVSTVMEDSENNIWLGTFRGATILSPNRKDYIQINRVANDPTTISGRSVSCMFEDSKGSIWIGTQQNGLNKLLSQKKEQYIFKRYPVNPGQPGFMNNERITCFAEDHLGRLWIGTYGGLHLYNEQKDFFTCFSVKSKIEGEISSDIITSLYVDDHQILWVGTPNGLNKLDLNKKNYHFQHYFESHGLPSDYINAIAGDVNDCIWLSTNYGISQYNTTTNQFRNFNRSDGLTSSAFAENSMFQSKVGKIYFGGIKGITVFSPAEIKDNLSVPKVAFTELKIDNTQIHIGEEFNGRVVLNKNLNEVEKISLTYEDKVVSFGFASLSFTAPEKNRYQYKLDGFNEEWVLANSQREATYTSLRPGNYTFLVKGSNNSNIWNETPIELKLVVLPPYWKTAWAFTIYAIFIVVLLYVIRRITIAQVQLKQNLALATVTSEKEHELHELKSRFFTNVSHEIRTPLTLIIGPLEEMLQGNDLSSSFRQKLNALHMNASHLLRLVSQLMEFRRVETGKQILKAAEGNFSLFCEELYISFREYAKSRNIKFSFLRAEENLNAWFDRDKFEIILCNLLLNAFKYTPEGGDVTFTLTQDIKLEKDISKGFVVVKIKDSGKGIPTENQPQIFNRFYQVANSDTANISGSGIGLSLVKDLLELHGGEINLQSSPENGTEFTVMLPLGKDHLNTEQVINDFVDSNSPIHYKTEEEDNLTGFSLANDGQEMDADAERSTILIVDDNAEIRRYVVRIFSSIYKIIEAENGQKGLDLALKEIPDLIISDVMMPVKDGITLCKEVKAHQSTSHIPVILLTARTSNVFKIEGLSTGADDYITKPFHYSELKARVDNLIAGRENLREYFGKKVTLEPLDIEVSDTEADFLKKAMDIVEENIDHVNMGADMLCEGLGMSQSSLFRKLKALTGQSISDFIRSIRIKRSAQYLNKSDLSVKEVAFSCGFSDVKYFRKCFMDQFGVNPTEYKIQQNLS